MGCGLCEELVLGGSYVVPPDVVRSVLFMEGRGQKCRIISYIGVFVTIAGKCLCGYEYISTIMMGMISFLLADLIVATFHRDKKRCILLSRTVVVMGLAALAGFIAAIAIHAKLRGAGDIIKGIKDIVEQDVLRRVGGGDLNALPERYWASLNASAWETCRKYLHFPTEIITGMAGNLFLPLCIAPLGIFWCDHRKGRLDLGLPVMYAVNIPWHPYLGSSWPGPIPISIPR